MSEPRRRRWRVYVFWALVLALLAALALAFSRSSHDSHLQMRLDLSKWQFGRYQERHISAWPQTPFPPGVMPPMPRTHSSVASGYHLGPLTVFKWWVEDGPDPLGTNTLSVGDRLFDPVTQREMWRVLALDRDHDFEDGTYREAVRMLLLSQFSRKGNSSVS